MSFSNLVCCIKNDDVNGYKLGNSLSTGNTFPAASLTTPLVVAETVHKIHEESIRVYHPKTNEKGYRIAVASGGWLKGLYDSVESALLGAKYDLMLNEDFYEMQKRVNHFDREDRLITVNDFDFLEGCSETL